jgi:glycosyltransferase involved in cell wall biosynthesis
MTAPLVSIVIDNFNYARFLRRSVGSALDQTYPNVEVVVVDDASTDGSQEVIRSYGARVVPVLKEVNAGHGAAFNSGFRAARGDLVLFLDADDYLYREAAERVVQAWRPGVAKAQFRLDLVDGEGRVLDAFPAPEIAFDSGDVVPLLLSTGRYEATVTSGNAFARAALEAILPMPEEAFRQGGDGYLVTLAPLYGEVVSIEERLGAYVHHGGNHSDFARKLPARLRWRLAHDEHRLEALRRKAAERGLAMAPRPWLGDASHLESRIASLCLDPASHPEPGESRLGLGVRGAWATRRARLPGRRRAVMAAWFLLVGTLPRSLATQVVGWRFDKGARSAAMERLLGLLRRATR